MLDGSLGEGGEVVVGDAARDSGGGQDRGVVPERVGDSSLHERLEAEEPAGVGVVAQLVVIHGFLGSACGVAAGS